MTGPLDARNRLRELLIGLREAAGVSGRELTLHVGSDQSTISRIETGANRPSYDMLLRLLDFYGASPADREQAMWWWECSELPQQARRIPEALGLDQTGPSTVPSLAVGVQAAREAADRMEQIDDHDLDRQDVLLGQAEAQVALLLASVRGARARLRRRTPCEG